MTFSKNTQSEHQTEYSLNLSETKNWLILYAKWTNKIISEWVLKKNDKWKVFMVSAHIAPKNI